MKTSFFLLFFLLISCASYHDGPVSDHFDGTYFSNSVPHNKGFFDMLGLAFGGPSADWPDEVPVVTQKVPQKRLSKGISYTFINHATILIQVDGINILTDPIYSERASPVSFAGPKRVRQPGVKFEDLPDIDVVIVSHDHYDHLDIPTLKKLQSHNQSSRPPKILTGLGNHLLFDTEGIKNYQTMDWEDEFRFGGLKFFYVECQHRSGRGVFDHKKTLWGSFVIEAPSGKIYFAGDTAYSPHFKDQGQRYGPFDLAFIPVGAYEPRWFMKDVHVNPEEASWAHRDLRSKFSVGIHFGTFKLTYEGIDEPKQKLNEALDKMKIPHDHFIVPQFGESRSI